MSGMHSDEMHRLTPYQHCLLWLLGAVERVFVPLLPRGRLRNKLRARIDRAQARLHARVHGTSPESN
jgi:hypothetical protein